MPRAGVGRWQDNGRWWQGADSGLRRNDGRGRDAGQGRVGMAGADLGDGRAAGELG